MLMPAYMKHLQDDIILAGLFDSPLWSKAIDFIKKGFDAVV